MDDLWAPRAFSHLYPRGLVESYFLKINDSQRQWAAWIKYTFLKPSHHGNPRGECWFIFFDRRRRGERRVIGTREGFDLQHCQVSSDRSEILIEDNLLTPQLAAGVLDSGEIRWKVRFEPDEEPQRLLPSLFYSEWIPTLKLTSPVTGCRGDGLLQVRGQRIPLSDAEVSLGHNWGRKHSPRYAWGQLSGLVDGEPAFFEGFSLPLSGDTGPRTNLTAAVLRIGRHRYLFNTPYSFLRNSADVRRDSWEFECVNRQGTLHGRLDFPKNTVAALRYVQTDGTVLACLNSMVSSGTLRFTPKGRGRKWIINEKHSCALEFLTPNLDHGYSVLV